MWPWPQQLWFIFGYHRLHSTILAKTNLMIFSPRNRSKCSILDYLEWPHLSYYSLRPFLNEESSLSRHEGVYGCIYHHFDGNDTKQRHLDGYYCIRGDRRWNFVFHWRWHCLEYERSLAVPAFGVWGPWSGECSWSTRVSITCKRYLVKY